MKIVRKRLILSLLVAGSLFVNMPLARADLTLTLTSGSTTQTITSNTGLVNYIGAVGGWNVNSTTGVSSPLLNEPGMDLDTLSISSSGTTNDLVISLAGTGFSAPIQGLSTWFGGTLLNASVTYNAFLDGNLIGSLAASSNSFSGGTSAFVNPGSTYSLKQVITIHDIGGTGNSLASVDAQINTPEPASITFLGTVLVGVAFGWRRKFGCHK